MVKKSSGFKILILFVFVFGFSFFLFGALNVLAGDKEDRLALEKCSEICGERTDSYNCTLSTFTMCIDKELYSGWCKWDSSNNKCLCYREELPLTDWPKFIESCVTKCVGGTGAYCCECKAWTNVGCGKGSCEPIQMYKTRECADDCDFEEGCGSNPSCETCANFGGRCCDDVGWGCTGSGGIRDTFDCPGRCCVGGECIAPSTPTPPPTTPPPTTPPAVAPGPAITITNPLDATTFQELIDSIISFIFYIGLALAPLMIIIAAFYLLTSAGDPKRVETAKSIIMYTVIGLAIILLAKGLVAVIQQVLGGT